MENISNHLKNKRNNLSEGSLKTYSSILYNLNKKVFQSENFQKNFSNYKKIKKYLKEFPVNSRKTILSALYVYTDNPEYKEDMLDDIKQYDKQIDKQEKTETQKNNWLDNETLQSTLDKLKKEASLAYKHLLTSKNRSEYYQTIQNYILLSLLSGNYINPRRSKDYTEFKIKNINPQTDNYIKGTKLYFNTYKGSSYKGQQVINIPTSLKTILTKWIKVNPTEYLFFDSKDGKLNSVKITQRLNNIFGKHISVNALRHTFLTDKHKDTLDNLEEMKEDFKAMGSSILQAKTYIKKE